MDTSPAFSNSIRLTPRQWRGVAIFTIAFVLVTPTLWNQIEPFPLEPDYRMPYEISQDYWLFERYAALAAEHFDVCVLGDSVIWGEYVTRQQTLTHYLNRKAGKERFANLGLEGAYPLALVGLVQHYAGPIRDRRVIVHCNPLWMSSPQKDLQEDSKDPILHPRLIPQFGVPRYREEITKRLGVLIEQRTPFLQWTNHLQQAYYSQSDMPGWTLEHPYDNPLRQLTKRLPPSSNELRAAQQPWYQGRTQLNYEWFDPAKDRSLQWEAFQETVHILQGRGNHVFVVVGPFNEHMLTDESKKRHGKVKDMIASWLTAQQIPHVVAELLPSEHYADASHPLPEGYARLADMLWADAKFRE